MGKLKTKFLDWLFEGYNNEFLTCAQNCLDSAKSSIKHAEECIANSKDNFNFAGEVIGFSDKLAAKNDELLERSKSILKDMKKMNEGYKLVIREHMALINAVNEHEDSEAIFARFASIFADSLMDELEAQESPDNNATEN